jgi:hypothetical protein
VCSQNLNPRVTRPLPRADADSAPVGEWKDLPDFPWWPVVANKNLSSHESRTSDDPSAPLLAASCAVSVDYSSLFAMPESNDATRRAYLKEHNVEKVLLAAIAKILKERPADPITALGTALSKPKSGFVSHTNWPAGLPPFISHAGPYPGAKAM